MAISVSQRSSEGLKQLEYSLVDVRRLLQDGALTEELGTTLREAFGSLFSQDAGAELLQLLAAGSYQWPEVEFLSGKEVQDALDTYEISARSIDLVEDFVGANAAASQQLVAFGREGLGYSSDDVQLNLDRDFVGDEGTIVSALVEDRLDEVARSVLQAEQDQDSLLRDAQSVTVDFTTYPDSGSDTPEPSAIQRNSVFEPQSAPTTISSANAPETQNDAIENRDDSIDVDAPEGNSGVIHRLGGGRDATLFNMDATTGVASSTADPTTELPGDVDANNVSGIPVTSTNTPELQSVRNSVATVNDFIESKSSVSNLDKVSRALGTSNVSQVTQISAGETITWTYNITNTANSAFERFQFVDDNGTVDITTDDLTIELAPNGTLTSNGISFIGGDSNGNGVFDVAETWAFIVRDVAEDLSVSINFDETQINGAGEIITNQYDSDESGFLEVSTPLNPFGAMIFDSANPTGGDFDLATPTQPTGSGMGSESGFGIGNVTAQNNVLIISEDGDQLDPDDNADGGTLRFSFGDSYGVALDAVSLLDIDATERMVTAESFLDSQLVASHEALALGDNSFQRLELQGNIANSLEVNFVHSGAVTALEYRRIFGKTAMFTAATNGQVLNQSVSSFYTNPLGSDV